MDDTKTTIQDMKDAVNCFISEREWEQFHTPKNVSMDIAVEASELMEHFLWINNEESYAIFNEKRKEIEDEVADIFMALIAFCNCANIDLSKAFKCKLAATKQKYPIKRVKGNCKKYDDL